MVGASIAALSGVYDADMSTWARRRDDLFAQWHLLGEPRQNVRGLVVTACGTSLGDDWSKLERIEDESVVGNRCPSCAGEARRR